MKASFAVIAIGATVVAAQDLASLPSCGMTCIQNMLALAPGLGCPSADAACLCRSADFGYGVRDCANEACGNAAEAQQVIAYGTQYCSGALASASGASSGAAGASALTATGAVAGATGASSASEGETASMTATGEGAMGSAITTSALTALVSGTDSVFTTTTGFTTIYESSGTESSGAEATGTNSEGQTTDSAGNVVGGAIAGATGSAASGAESASSSAASGASSVSSVVASGASGAAGAVTSSTSSGQAPIMTAAPMLAAGVLAMLAL